MSISSNNVLDKRNNFTAKRSHVDPFASIPLWKFLKDRISLGPSQNVDAPSTYKTYYDATNTRKFSDSLLASIFKGQVPKGKLSRRTNESKPSLKRFSPPKLPSKDLEKLREFVRYDNGLPTSKPKIKTKLNYTTSPSIPPRMNKAALGRFRYVNIYFPRRAKMYCCKKKYFMEHIMQPAPEIKQEEELRRLKKLAARYRKRDRNNEFRFNKVFVLRYKYNKGAPEIPSSFREFYEDYERPRFQHANKLKIPRKILEANIKNGQTSYLGIQTEMIIPLIAQSKDAKEKREKKKELKKGKRTLRLRNVEPPKRKPWNYGPRGKCQDRFDSLYK